jgi:hypothetical protein
MSEYFTKPLNNQHCKDKFAVGPNNGDYFIICDTEDEAHKLSLSLMLGKVPSPQDKAEDYEMCFEICGSKYFRQLNSGEVDKKEESAGLTSCCMSGCTGCPIFEERMKAK